MYCLNATSGNLIWHDLGIRFAELTIISSPAIAGGYVYVGGYVGSDGYVYCLNALTGAVVWAQEYLAVMGEFTVLLPFIMDMSMLQQKLTA